MLPSRSGAIPTVPGWTAWWRTELGFETSEIFRKLTPWTPRAAALRSRLGAMRFAIHIVRRVPCWCGRLSVPPSGLCPKPSAKRCGRALTLRVGHVVLQACRRDFRKRPRVLGVHSHGSQLPGEKIQVWSDSRKEWLLGASVGGPPLPWPGVVQEVFLSDTKTEGFEPRRCL